MNYKKILLTYLGNKNKIINQRTFKIIKFFCFESSKIIRSIDMK